MQQPLKGTVWSGQDEDRLYMVTDIKDGFVVLRDAETGKTKTIPACIFTSGRMSLKENEFGFGD